MNNIRKSKYSVWFLVTLMFISSVLTFGTQNAQAVSVQGDPLRDSIVEALEKSTPIEDGKEFYLEKVIDGVEEQGIKVYNNLNKIKNYMVYEINDTSDVIVTIYFNDKKNNYNMITAHLTNRENLVQFQELKGTINPENNEVHVMTYLNGVLMINNTYIEEEPEIQTFGLWSNFSDCMENQGVPSWIINLIVAGCAVVCVATVGSGCFFCAFGVAGNYSAQIGWCTGYAYRN